MLILFTSSATRHLDYIYAEGRVVALHVKNGNADSLYYILTDHLGSWNKVMNQNKVINPSEDIITLFHYTIKF